ncbi:hypothetical protein L873DRAFT_1274046 [Choiromyces venosus 120613-1]|uniref:Uncharacterized protein n=1 Tax=Choiromyces venosus 120613-1 TaxID=1336337 RepID=A0A3N4K4Y7_9PEZI|nr:hypothetical protein L873DRAFT_1274046 [Choiromyces venosus 120613-1]
MLVDFGESPPGYFLSLFWNIAEKGGHPWGARDVVWICFSLILLFLSFLDIFDVIKLQTMAIIFTLPLSSSDHCTKSTFVHYAHHITLIKAAFDRLIFSYFVGLDISTLLKQYYSSNINDRISKSRYEKCRIGGGQPIEPTFLSPSCFTNSFVQSSCSISKIP